MWERLLVYGHTRRCLVESLGAGKPLREIHAGDADRLAALAHQRSKAGGQHGPTP